MSAGKVIILITGRLKSTRLKRKALLDLEGKPMFQHMVERLKLALKPDEIVLCTSTFEEDSPLAELAVELGIGCYRGHPDDVLARLLGAAEKHSANTIINCMADNPLTDPEFIDRLVDFHREGDYDFSQTEGLPLGFFSYAIEVSALRRVCEMKDDEDTEIWGAYFTETGEFDCGVLKVSDPDIVFPGLRLTVDTAPDFELVSQIFGELGTGGRIFPIRETIAFCRENVKLLELNSGVNQRRGHAIKIKK